MLKTKENTTFLYYVFGKSYVTTHVLSLRSISISVVSKEIPPVFRIM